MYKAWACLKQNYLFVQVVTLTGVGETGLLDVSKDGRYGIDGNLQVNFFPFGSARVSKLQEAEVSQRCTQSRAKILLVGKMVCRTKEKLLPAFRFTRCCILLTHCLPALGEQTNHCEVVDWCRAKTER